MGDRVPTSYQVNVQLGRRWLDELLTETLSLAEYTDADGRYVIEEADGGRDADVEAYLAAMAIPYIHKWDGHYMFSKGTEYCDPDLGEVTVYGDHLSAKVEEVLAALDEGNESYFDGLRKEQRDIQAIKDLVASEDRNSEAELIRRLLASVDIESLSTEQTYSIAFMLPYLDPYLKVTPKTGTEGRLVDLLLPLFDKKEMTSILDADPGKLAAFTEKLDSSADIDILLKLKGLESAPTSPKVTFS